MISSEEGKATQKNLDGHINIKIEAPNGQAIKISSKPSTKVKKLLDAYCKSKNIQSSDFRLVFKNQFLAEHGTLEEYGMQDGDIIYVMAQQTGGF